MESKLKIGNIYRNSHGDLALYLGFKYCNLSTVYHFQYIKSKIHFSSFEVNADLTKWEYDQNATILYGTVKV